MLEVFTTFFFCFLGGFVLALAKRMENSMGDNSDDRLSDLIGSMRTFVLCINLVMMIFWFHFFIKPVYGWVAGYLPSAIYPETTILVSWLISAAAIVLFTLVCLMLAGGACFFFFFWVSGFFCKGPLKS